MNARSTSSTITLVAAIVLLSARPADAAPDETGYTVATASGLYETPPAGAVEMQWLDWRQQPGNMVDMPFDFPFYGKWYDRLFIQAHGIMELRQNVGIFLSNNIHLYDVVTAGDQPNGGLIAPYWNQSYVKTTGRVLTWTAGDAPDRRFYVTWEHVGDKFNYTKNDITFQVKLLEATGQIVFAYAADSIPSTWDYGDYTHGLAAPDADGRYVGATTVTSWNEGHPDNDYIFTPKTFEVSGTVLYDRDVADANGVGNTFEEDLPLAGVRIETRNADGSRSSFGTTDTTGSFRFSAFTPSPNQTSTLRATAASLAASVREDGNAVSPFDHVIIDDLDSAVDVNVGTLRIERTDGTADLFRAAAHAAVLMQRAWEFIKTETGEQLPTLDVHLNDADTREGRFQAPRKGVEVSLRIAGPAAGNPDTWDEAIVMRGFGRHVAGALGGFSDATPDETIDAITDAERAFAGALGYHLYAIVTGETEAFDTSSASEASTFDLESPTLDTRRGPDVLGWVAAALFDLVDDANEPHDWAPTDGVGRLVRAVARLDSAPTAERVDAVWQDLGEDGLDFSRIGIHHGLFADDELERNDSTTEAADLGTIGVRRDGLVLNRLNVDWFVGELASPTSSIGVDVAFARAATPASVAIEIFGADGTSLALTSDRNGLGPITARTAPVSAGSYRIRVTHIGGERVPEYAFQVFPRLELSPAPLSDWTVGRPFDHELDLEGGILPYTLSDAPIGGRPAGLVLDGNRVRGTPTTAGTFEFSLRVDDAGVPLHSVIRSYEMVINDALDLGLSEFVAFPAGRVFDVTYPHIGGTAPIAFTISAGSLPSGASMDADGMRLRGSVPTPGMTAVTIDAVDVAGSADQASVGAVACAALVAKKTPAPLAAGLNATGYFVDAVAGSRIDVSVTTAKKRAKRALRVVVLGPDGRVRTEAKFKSGKGKASVKKLIADMTGRYFVVVAAEAGEATELLASPKVKPGKKAKGTAEALDVGETFEIRIGALAGATLRLKLKPAKKSDLVIRVIALVSSNGIALPLGPDVVTTKGSQVTLQTTLPESGTWTVTVRAQSGSAADVAWTQTVKQPKGVVYAQD